MDPKVLQAITFLGRCSPGELREKLRGNPPDWKVYFDENSAEYAELVQAFKSNQALQGVRTNPIYAPTAVKLVNTF